VEQSEPRAVVIDLAQYLRDRRRSDQTAASTDAGLPLYVSVRDTRLEQQMAHRRRMLDHLSTTAREYA